MNDKAQLLLDFIDGKIDYLERTTVTDGVHTVPINEQVIALLQDIKSYIYQVFK